MEESKKPPEFGSLDELLEFLENNDMGEYLNTMPEVHFDVSRGREAAKARRRYMVAVDEPIMKKVRARAEAEHTTTQALINAWLEEKTLQPA